MVIQHTYFFALLIFLLVAERLGEVRSAKRNTRRLIEIGGREFGASHYPTIIAMHVAFFLGLGIEFVLRGEPLARFWPLPFGVFVAAQALRFFTRRAMGDRWTTRIIVVPGESLVTKGPFGFMRHPIYFAVALELLTIPLIFGLYATCFTFSILNALMLLFVRIPTEQDALNDV